MTQKPFAVLALLGAFAMKPVARAGFSLGDALNYAVLYEGHGGQTLSLNNGPGPNGLAVNGNIGIGYTGHVQLSGPLTIDGNFDFSNAVRCNNNCVTNGNIVINGVATGNVTAVGSALSTANSLSQTLGLEIGTGTAVSNGGSINASAGTLDGSGNRVFHVTSVNLTNNHTFTINGAAGDFVVLNVALGNVSFNGEIVLAGGITSDHVLINLTPNTSNLTTYNNDYANLTGGPTLTISTNQDFGGAATTGVFLDPTGNFQVNHSVVNGRIISGDSQNSSVVSGGYINAPSVPEPAFFVPLGLGMAFIYGHRRMAARHSRSTGR